MNISALLKAPEIVSVDMSQVTTMILAGGNGTRLSPLTDTRCKPAVCFGGKYRLIDIPISLAIHSGCPNIFIISQYLSYSLNQHIFNTFHPGRFPSTAIELISAEQKHQEKSWFEGTACAVRKNIHYFTDTRAEYFLILSGDQLYNMNFKRLIHFAKETEADLVVAATPVDEEDAKRMGIMKVDENFRVKEFHEKPQTEEQLNHLGSLGRPKKFLGSMGIYVFKRQALIDLLKSDLREDFGKHLVPTGVAKGNVSAYIHTGYWKDIGTIESFFNANIALTVPDPEFKWCNEQNQPIFFRQHYLGSPKVVHSAISNSIICDGSIVEAAEVVNSIIGLQSLIKPGSIIRNSYVIGNDFLHSERPPQIGENCLIDRAIIDKNVVLGKNVQLVNKKKLTTYDQGNICIRDGIIVVPRGSHLPDGFIL